MPAFIIVLSLIFGGSIYGIETGNFFPLILYIFGMVLTTAFLHAYENHTGEQYIDDAGILWIVLWFVVIPVVLLWKLCYKFAEFHVKRFGKKKENQ